MQTLLDRELRGTDLVFPAMSSTGQLKFGERTTRSSVDGLMKDLFEPSGVLAGRNGKFTLHCFRRGGAQWRFMWADKLFSLKAAKWWGGWSAGDSVSGASLKLF